MQNNVLRTEQPKRAKNIEFGLFLCSPALQAQSLLARAQLRSAADNLSEALKLYQLLIERYAYEHYTLEAHIGSAALHERQGDLSRALKTYETALLAHPNDVRTPQIRLHIQRLRAALQERQG